MVSRTDGDRVADRPIRRGGVHWAEIDGRRPVLVVQAQPYNDSRLPTVLAVVLRSDRRFAAVPGNVFLPATVSGLPEDAVADVTAVRAVDRCRLDRPVGQVPAADMVAVDDGLRRVLGLP